MAIVIGVNPGGRGKFAVSALYWSGSLPAWVIAMRAHSGVDEVLKDIMGVCGEWGELKTVAIDAPLSWSSSPTGIRTVDQTLQEKLPLWAPKTWVRPPNVIPGAIAVQGPALAWRLAYESAQGQLSPMILVETHPRISLANRYPDLSQAIIEYGQTAVSYNLRRLHIQKMVERFIQESLLKFETPHPATPSELDALVSSLVALALAFPECGLSTELFASAEIQPVGERTVAILSPVSSS